MERLSRFKTTFRFFLISYLASAVVGWKAIPANQATYALRSSFGRASETLSDEFLPRDAINHIYKFGWCTRDVVRLQYFRKSVNVTLPTWQNTQGTYLYMNIGEYSRMRMRIFVTSLIYIPRTEKCNLA